MDNIKSMNGCSSIHLECRGVSDVNTEVDGTTRVKQEKEITDRGR